MKMISLWLAFCIVIPGVVHQITSIMYPLNYMTDYLDVSREQRGDIFDLSTESLEKKLLDELDLIISSEDLQFIEHNVNEVVKDVDIEIIIIVYESYFLFKNTYQYIVYLKNYFSI